MESLNRKAVILTVIILANISFAGTYSGGFGTETNPYQIGTVADWQELMATSADWDANFIMIADINLQGVPLIPVGNDINYVVAYFKGVFDGNGHVVRNAAINLPGQWQIGLFGVIDSNSQIRNLGVEDANMSGGRDVAGLVGLSRRTITNCYATGKMGWPSLYMLHTVNFGGLVGRNRGTIRSCHANCDVNNRGYSGGLVGRNEGGTIVDSYTAGTVSDQFEYVGGLVGWNGGKITDSYADGIINGGEYVGGLVGENDVYLDEITGQILSIGTIARCYAAGSAIGNHYVGGLVGQNGGLEVAVKTITITDCYSTCAVTGGAGLVGINYCLRDHNNITNCYAAGKVIGNGGGLVGSGGFTTSKNCFWDIEATGQTASASGTGLTTAQMKTLSIFKSAGWDFVDTWGIGENQTYPFLRTYSGADLNYDGMVNFNNFAVWANHWLEGI